MRCLPSMPKRARRNWTTLRATSCVAKKLLRCSRRSRPRLPQHVQRHCPLAPWAKPRTTRWRFGRNSRASWNTRNLSSATISPKTPCALWRLVAKTGFTSAASQPDPKSPPSSPSSKPAAASTFPSATIWLLSSLASPTPPSTTSPNSPLPYGPQNKISPPHNLAASVNHVVALTHTVGAQNLQRYEVGVQWPAEKVQKPVGERSLTIEL